ncbi:hypothetical protein E2553_27340 [Paraburkholderia dipogonis]|uniref:Uncharacterized protein n=1 Tax=Paraburkholderia dipogonis TaxID=1211383 RepID=A0A4Y8MSJ8_9BURK|nr:hypothetical protein [Paraburkholderia dipogonis]TFE40467.1 hypothetical protein E2553_27340 [Paraburkholderia dipogonis]
MAEGITKDIVDRAWHARFSLRCNIDPCAAVLKELVHRKEESQAAEVLEEIRRSGDFSVGTFIEISKLLAGAGIDMQVPGFDATTAIFSAAFAESASGAKVLLQTLTDCGGEVNPGIIREVRHQCT